MRIKDITVHPLQAPGRTLVVVLVQTDQGIVGIGEAGLQRRWRAIEGAVDHLKRWLIGESPFRIEYLWQRMWRGGFYPADRLIGSAVSAIDIALWDIKGKALRAPVYELLGGRCRDFVEVFTNPGYLDQARSTSESALCKSAQNGSVDAAVQLANQAKSRGLKYLRLGLPTAGDVFDSSRAIEQLTAQVAAIRSEVGRGLEIMVDLHTRLSPEEAIRFCRNVEPIGMFAVEDPIRCEQPLGYRRIREQTSVPIAAGEQWCGKWEFREAIEKEWIDFARVDVCIAGGITESRKIAILAESHNIKMLFHNPLGPVCTAASLHLDLCCDNAGPQEVLFSPDLLPKVFQCDFSIQNGERLTVPTTPGLGVRFDVEAAKEYPAEMTEPPHYQRPDGSFTNY